MAGDIIFFFDSRWVKFWFFENAISWVTPKFDPRRIKKLKVAGIFTYFEQDRI